MKRFFATFVLLSTMLCAMAQQLKNFEIDMWPDGLPNSNGIDKTQPYDAEARNFKPMIRVYQPEDSVKTDMAILVIPGGGYRVLSLGQEGYDWANVFVPQGITTVVLNYRMPNGVTDVPISDATEAMRLIREDYRITREQLAVILYNYAKYKEIDLEYGASITSVPYHAGAAKYFAEKGFNVATK